MSHTIIIKPKETVHVKDHKTFLIKKKVEKKLDEKFHVTSYKKKRKLRKGIKCISTVEDKNSSHF